ncbi:hypothetical protein GCM10023334_102790 [Nonomuraea thailandensis]
MDQWRVERWRWRAREAAAIVARARAIAERAARMAQAARERALREGPRRGYPSAVRAETLKTLPGWLVHERPAAGVSWPAMGPGVPGGRDVA